MLTSADSEKLPVLFEELLTVVSFAISPPKFGCVDAKPLTSTGKMTQVHTMTSYLLVLRGRC